MKKIQFLQTVAQATFPVPVVVRHSFGLRYRVETLDSHRLCYMYADRLKGGRVSIKFKPFTMSYPFLVLEDRLKTFISTAPQSTFFTDAATKVDTYQSKGYMLQGMVLRLKCDKAW